MTDSDNDDATGAVNPLEEVSGPWVDCPRCGGQISLGRFEPSDDEPGMAVGVCPSCSERVDLLSG